MAKQHEKSPCCQGVIWRCGSRRRECSLCGKTWRLWKRKRGRKHRRKNFNPLFRYLNHVISPHATDLKPATQQARLRKQLKQYIQSTPWPQIPQGKLIAIADGMWEFNQGKLHTFYFILLRSTRSSTAVIMPVFLAPGSERTTDGWEKAFQQLPPGVQKRIVAVVCDGAQGLIKFGRLQNWTIQRCQFHLKARLAHCVSSGPRNRHPAVGQKIQRLVHLILTQPDERLANQQLQQLQVLSASVPLKGLHKVVSGFVKHHEDYRAYLRHPNWHLPTTSNSAEFLIGQIRDVQYRAHGFRSISSLSLWIEAWCKYHKTITCRGKYPPN